MACPTHLFTSGVNVWGLGTWDGGTKISLRLSTGYIATYSYPDFTFLYSNHFPSTVTGYTGTIINMSVSEDGHAFMWVRLTGESVYKLYRYDIAANASSLIYTSTWGSQINVRGPTWNPNDGRLYEVINDGTGTYELVYWETDGTGPTSVTSIVGYGYGVGNPTFTDDGAIWFDCDDGSIYGYMQTVRYSGGSTTFSHGTSTDIMQSIPRDSTSAWVAHEAGKILHADGSQDATDCALFESPGTARVHCGVDGLITFLYPTSGGVGTAVYGHSAATPTATGGWRVGRVGWPAGGST